MFGSTQKVVLTLDADGKATAVTSSTTETMFAGAISHITSLLSEDTVVIGAGRIAGEALTHYGAMTLVNHKLTGRFNLNPLSVANQG